MEYMGVKKRLADKPFNTAGQSRPIAGHLARRTGFYILVAIASLAASSVQADLISLPGMTPTQAAAADTNQRIYDTWVDPATGGADTSLGLTSSQIETFDNARELVETRNEQEGSGPTGNSLSLDEEGLRDSLQWNAQEEFASQGTIATKTINGQQAAIVRRLAAIRGGATGFSISGFEPQWPSSALLAYLPEHDATTAIRGGSASADDTVSYSKLGFFVTGARGWGDQDNTSRVNAIDYDSYGATAGLDYRFTSSLVFGAAASYSKIEADFDSSKSIADGNVDSDGYSASLYGTYEKGGFYADGAASYGWIAYDMVRSIKYPSNNPNVPSVNERADSDTDSTQYNIGIGAGYNGQYKSLSYGPFARVNYMKIDIDDYEERGAGVFNMAVDDQEITSFTSSLGASASYAVSHRRGVVLPYLRAEWLHEFENDSESINAAYLGSADPVGAISTLTDDPDRDFFVVGGGISALFRSGIQAFIMYEALLGYENLSSNLVTFGGRMEF